MSTPERIFPHPFELGQKWKNKDYTIYIGAVDNDLPDENGVMQVGMVGATTDMPIPGKAYRLDFYHPKTLMTVMEYYGYELQKDGWIPEFQILQKRIQLEDAAAQARASAQKPKPMSGIGFVR